MNIAFFLGKDSFEQINLFKKMSLSEQDEILSEFADYIYEHQQDQYERGLLKTAPDREDLEQYTPDLEAQKEKAQREFNLQRLRRYQDIIKSYYFTDEGAQKLLDDFEDIEEEEVPEFEDDESIPLYIEESEHDAAFRLAQEVMDLARKYGLPHPDKYTLAMDIKPDVGTKSEKRIILEQLEILRREAANSKVKFSKKHFRVGKVKGGRK